MEMKRVIEARRRVPLSGCRRVTEAAGEGATLHRLYENPTALLYSFRPSLAHLSPPRCELKHSASFRAYMQYTHPTGVCCVNMCVCVYCKGDSSSTPFRFVSPPPPPPLQLYGGASVSLGSPPTVKS